MKRELHHALHTLIKGMPHEKERFMELFCEAIDCYNYRAVDVSSGRRVHRYDYESSNNGECCCGDDCNCNSEQHHHAHQMHAKIIEELEALKKSIDALNESVRVHVSQNSKPQ
ncbi:MAG: hypothetical protein R3Y04_09805 [Rikenellaceae bacterium]